MLSRTSSSGGEPRPQPVGGEAVRRAGGDTRAEQQAQHRLQRHPTEPAGDLRAAAAGARLDDRLDPPAPGRLVGRQARRRRGPPPTAPARPRPPAPSPHPGRCSATGRVRHPRPGPCARATTSARAAGRRCCRPPARADRRPRGRMPGPRRPRPGPPARRATARRWSRRARRDRSPGAARWRTTRRHRSAAGARRRTTGARTRSATPAG